MRFAIVSAALIILILGSIATGQDPSTTIITIENPKENASVKSTILVEGRIDPFLADNEKIWIVVRPLESFNNYWPQSGGPLVPNNNKFSGVAFLGGSTNAKFEISVLVVDNNLSDSLTKWVLACTSQDNWPPITEDGVGYTRISKQTIDMNKKDSRWVTLQ
jgi:hypothetical protein